MTDMFLLKKMCFTLEQTMFNLKDFVSLNVRSSGFSIDTPSSGLLISSKNRIMLPFEFTIDAVKIGLGYPLLIEHVTTNVPTCNGTLTGPLLAKKKSP